MICHSQVLLACSADVVVDITNEDAVKVVLHVTNGRGAYAAIDAVGGTSTGLLASCVRDRGTATASLIRLSCCLIFECMTDS
jgi:NADPH:quinone reductase-like Zn-dependent oxidoreductase